MIKVDLTNRYYRFLFNFLVVLPARCFVPDRVQSSLPLTSPKTHAQKMTYLEAAKTREDASFLPLSSFDRRKFQHMKTRGRVMPVIVMGEPILPGQRLYFRSGDPKFEELIKYIAQIERDYADSGGGTTQNIEVGVLGYDPETGQPLSTGVTAPVQTTNFAYSLTADNQDRAITTSFKGERMFRLAGDPWMDPSGSFHMAHVEILNGRYDDEPHSRRQDTQIETDKLFAQIPVLVDEWMELMFEAGLATPASLVKSQKEIMATNQQQQQQLQKEDDPRYRIRRRNNNYALYPPRRQTERAIWVAALLNPIRRYPITVSEEIRPALLACRNDRDRLVLCISALSTSIDFLKIYVDAKKRGGSGGDSKQ